MRALPPSGKAAEAAQAAAAWRALLGCRREAWGIADTVAPVIKAYLNRAKAAEVSARQVLHRLGAADAPRCMRRILNRPPVVRDFLYRSDAGRALHGASALTLRPGDGLCLGLEWSALSTRSPCSSTT